MQRRLLLTMLALAAVALAACGGPSGSSGSSGSSGTPTTPTTPATSGATTATGASTGPTGTNPVSPAPHGLWVYFLDGALTIQRARIVPATPAMAFAAVQQLLLGPTPAEAAAGTRTAIPAGTSLRAVSIAGGIATVDLSQRFATAGTTASMRARVAQVVWTLTQYPTVHAVRFKLGGAPVAAIGPVAVTQPQTRATWAARAPAIDVSQPLPLTRASGSLVLAGTANVFEGTLQVQLIGADGSQLVRTHIQASSGTGTRGSFKATLALPAGAPTGGASLRIWEESMKDGSALHKVTVPIAVVP